jgi:beta-lactam-binding protein with PASTA domain
VTRLAAFVLLAVLVAGCDPQGGNTQAPPADGTSESAKSSGALNKPFSMPDVVGSNLQSAKDTLKQLTGDPLFLTSSHDATSQNRHQILAHDWKVCAQKPAPGTQFTIKTSVIDFAVVRTEETCP